MVDNSGSKAGLILIVWLSSRDPVLWPQSLPLLERRKGKEKVERKKLPFKDETWNLIHHFYSHPFGQNLVI